MDLTVLSDSKKLGLDENCKVTILLKFRLLGEFEVLGGTGHPVGVLAKKGRALLAVLALSPAGSMPRQRLANFMWGDRGEEQARGSLRQTLASLRRDFAAIDTKLLSADDEKIILNRGRIEIDVVEFQRLAGSDDIGDLRRAMALYRGELLADAEISQMEFEDWMASERTRLHTIAFTCAEKLLPLETVRNRVEPAKRLVALEPLSELGAPRLDASLCGRGGKWPGPTALWCLAQTPERGAWHHTRN